MLISVLGLVGGDGVYVREHRAGNREESVGSEGKSLFLITIRKTTGSFLGYLLP